MGWIRFDGTGSSYDYGVTVGDTILTGYAWSENADWIHMASTSASCVQPGGDCASGYAYNVAATTTNCSVGWKCLSGYAWGEGVGWISFATSTTDYTNASASTYGVYIDNNNNFQGYAWGEQVGWIHFSGSCSESGNCPGGEDTYGVIYPTIGIEQQINIIDQNYNNDTASYLPNDNSLGLIKWDGSKYSGEAVYFEAVLNDGTSWGRIRDDTDLAGVLSDNTNYTVRIKLDTNCYASLYSKAGVQVAASEISTSTASWTAQNFKNLYNADNFSGGTFTYYFEATLKDNTSTSATRLNPGSLGAVGGSFADYTRSSSTSITLVDDTDYDSEIKYADVSTSWLVIRALGLRSGAPYIIENIITIEGDIKFD